MLYFQLQCVNIDLMVELETIALKSFQEYFLQNFHFLHYCDNLFLEKSFSLTSCKLGECLVKISIFISSERYFLVFYSIYVLLGRVVFKNNDNRQIRSILCSHCGASRKTGGSDILVSVWFPLIIQLDDVPVCERRAIRMSAQITIVTVVYQIRIYTSCAAVGTDIASEFIWHLVMQDHEIWQNHLYLQRILCTNDG